MQSREAPARGTLAPIFSPRSVAVVGASRNRETIGYALLDNLIQSEFEGIIYPINPNAEVIHSLRCYPSVSAIDGPVDLAVIVVPRRLVPPVVDECLEKGVRGLVVITAGYREVGPEGAEEERKLRDRIREAGLRMVGPNCMGVINADPNVRLNATFAPAPASPGSIGFVSQSGALGVAILNVAAGLGIGFTQFVSMGNKADVSGNDLLEYWENDPATRVVAMYLESFGNPRKFTQIAKRVTKKKPILVVKSGRTEAGARAASSHTGALAGTDVTVSAFLEQCGVIRANTIGELFDIAQALDRCPAPRGNRVSIVTNAGGPAIMATDACVNLGLDISNLSDDTQQKLRTFLPAEASVANPVDMIASAGPVEYGKAVATLLEDPQVDMVLAVHVMPLTSTPLEVLSQVSEAAAQTPDKPVVSVMMVTGETWDRIHGRPEFVPVYQFPESAALALSKLHAWGAWKEKPLGDPEPAFDVDDDRVQQVLSATPEGYLSAGAAFEVLEAYGIPVAPWKVAKGSGAVLPTAEEVGFPVVIKADAEGIVHKSDVGGVAVDLRTPDEVQKAVSQMQARIETAGGSVDRFLVQRLIRGGHEVIFGVSSDPRMGPILMFGLGGKYVEVFGDVRFAIPPLSRTEARDVVRGIRGIKLLEGVRGDKPADMDRLAEILLRISQLVDRHPRIVELDINPFVAAAEEPCAVDVRIRVEES